MTSKVSDLSTLTTRTAIKVSRYVAKLEKFRKVRKELTQEDIEKFDKLHGLIWALSDLTSAIDILSSSRCSEELTNNIRRLAVSICETIDEII